MLPYDQNENVWSSQYFSFDDDAGFCDENEFEQDGGEEVIVGGEELEQDPVPFSGPSQRVNQFA